MKISETTKAQGERTQRTDIGAETVQAIRDAMAAANINASGATSKSLNYHQDAYRLLIYAEGRHAPIRTLQHGNKPTPHGGNGFFPEILQWVKDKRIDVQPSPREDLDKAQRRVASAIYHNIWERGTERYNAPRADIYTPALDMAVDKFTAMVASAMVDKITK